MPKEHFLTVRKILCRNRVWGDRNFSRFFFIPNWEKIIIFPKRVRFGGFVAHNIEIHLTTPCICPGRISGQRRFFEKFRLWVPKIDFSQIGQISPKASKIISRCSLRLVWPPTSVVSLWVTFGRIKFFDNFWRFWHFWGIPQYRLYPPPSYTVNGFPVGKIEPWHLGAPYSQGSCKSMFGQGF